MNRPIFSAILLLGVLASPCVTYGQFQGMKSRIPADTNTLVLINAEKIFGSPVADRENWAARRKAAFESGVLALPPDATEVIIAGRQDLEYNESIWELALIRLNRARNVSTVAARYGGSMDNVAGRSAARLPNDEFVVQISDTLLGAYTPANRQDVSRWLKRTDKSEVGAKSRISPYLQRAIDYATKVGTPIVMGLDLEGVISPNEVARRAEQMESLKGVDLPLDKIASLISGVQGITLGVSIRDSEVGAIRVDFSESPKMLGNIGKPLLLEILRNQGAMIEDFHDWEPSINGNTFLLRGNLSTQGTRRALSVLELPASLADAMFEATSPGADQEGQAKLLATKQYWQSISNLVEDLRVKPKRDHVRTFGQAAMWYDRYARKIDRLPILNVDEDMMQYGIRMASMFREAEMIMKGVGQRSNYIGMANNPSSGGYGTSFGGYRASMGTSGSTYYGTAGVSVGVNAMNASRQAKGQSDAIMRTQVRSAGAANVQQIWQQIDEDTSAIRREMTYRYKEEF